jgi:hypothetical protein
MKLGEFVCLYCDQVFQPVSMFDEVQCGFAASWSLLELLFRTAALASS